jgi:hypothetical protein
MSSLGNGSTIFRFENSTGGDNVLPLLKVTSTDFGSAQVPIRLNTMAGGSTNRTDMIASSAMFEGTNKNASYGGKSRRRRCSSCKRMKGKSMWGGKRKMMKGSRRRKRRTMKW